MNSLNKREKLAGFSRVGAGFDGIYSCYSKGKP
jgi:hypothetical protein